MSTPASSIPAAIRDRISAPAQPRVWTPEDFADLGPRTAVDQALHRLVASRNLRRIARGFYDTPQDNRLTGKPTYPNPRDVIDALARKGKVRVVVDGLTAANDLGLTDAVPARIGVLTDGRLRPIALDEQDVGLGEPLQGRPEFGLGEAGDSLEKRLREVAPEYGADLGDLPSSA